MKKLAWLSVCLIMSACAPVNQEVHRLSPVREGALPPKECVLVSIQPGSAAASAGLQVGDHLQAVNGQVPSDASAVGLLIDQAPEDSVFTVLSTTGTPHPVHVHLKAQKPRLGAACDLTGIEKSGFTAAGNESLTVFNGPLALTVSGILDKGMAFVRVHFSNNSDHPVAIDPAPFSRQSGSAPAAPALSPEAAMCMLFGDRGLHLLTLRRQQAQTLETNTAAAGTSCPSGQTQGRFSSADELEVKANADYISSESLWPTTVAPNGSTEGLVYFPEPPSLPMKIATVIDGRALSVSLGDVLPQADRMSEAECVRFFSGLKKGTAVRLTTKKGKAFVGKFESYDSDNEKAWFDLPNGGLLSSVSYPVTSIRFATAVN